MKLEIGKYYRMRDGRKAGPAQYWPAPHAPGTEWTVPFPNGHPATYYGNGRRIGVDCDDAEDLISEWQEGPVRAVTRREIVPGVYGRVNVTGTYKGDRVTLDWVTDNFHDCPPITGMTADELRSAAMILTQLAEALDENADKA